MVMTKQAAVRLLSIRKIGPQEVKHKANKARATEEAVERIIKAKDLGMRLCI